MASTDKTRKRSLKQENYYQKESSLPPLKPFCLKRKTHTQVSEQLE